MQPNQQFNPFENPDPNQQTAPPANDPWAMPSQPSAQPGYQRPQTGVPPAQQPYGPTQPQSVQQNPFIQPAPATTAQPPAQQWNPETSMFEPVQPARPSQWEQQFVAETVAAATAPPAPKKSHAGRTIAIIIGILLLLGGAAAAYVYAQQKENEPQVVASSLDTKALFYDAIENHMSTEYVGQLYDLEQTDAMTGHAVAQAETVSDFSDPAKPKSRIIYNVDYPDDKTMADVSGEIIDLQEPSYYAMLAATDAKTPNETAAAAGVTMDVWYQVPRDDFTNSMFVFDTGGLRSAVNTSSGQVIVGNYPKDARQELMKLVKDKQVYKIKDAETVTVGNVKMTKYSVTIDGEGLKKLNDQAMATLGVVADEKKDFTRDTGEDVQYEFVVDNDNKRIAKVSIERPSEDKKSVDKVTISFTYPKNVADDLKKPTTIKALPNSTKISE